MAVALPTKARRLTKLVHAIAGIAVIVTTPGSSPVISAQSGAPVCGPASNKTSAPVELRQLAVAAAPAAFLPRLELARCYDLTWRFDEVEPAIREALTVLRAETHPAAAPSPVGGPLLAGIDVPVPVRTRFDLAKYPDQAVADGITGLVVVEATVDREGRVAKASVVKAVRTLDAAALEAAKKWRFAPSVVNGQRVEVLTYLLLRFGSGTTMWASDYLELSRFYYERELWSHAASALEVARETATSDAVRFGHAQVASSVGTPAGFGWPKVRKEVKPRYTEAATRARTEGTVEMRLLLDRFGVVGRIAVVKPLEHLTFVAELAAMQWRFTPATIDGRPVPAIVFLDLTFRRH